MVLSPSLRACHLLENGWQVILICYVHDHSNAPINPRQPYVPSPARTDVHIYSPSTRRV